MDQTQVKVYGGYLLPMSPQEATQEPWDLIEEEVVEAKPNEVLLLI